jgi:hypothetical protein
VFNPDVVGELGVTELTDYLSEIELNVRGISYKGRLFRIGLTLEADAGEHLDIESSVFVPTLSSGEIWPHPNFVGLEGFLSRIRFAVNPAENAFYFGSLEV